MKWSEIDQGKTNKCVDNSYLSNDLDRYQDIVKVPRALDGIKYRNLGTQ